MTALALSRLHFPVTTLGAGRRVGIWFQGCSIRCPGCVSMDTWAPDRGVTQVEFVLQAMASWIPIADGLTVTGGEPFDQLQALSDLLRGWRAAGGKDVFVFTGHSLEALRDTLIGMDGLVDALVTDPFDRDAPQTLALRGSDNQRLVALTPRGQELIRPYERPREPGDLSFDIMFEDETGSVFLAGIPRQGDIARFTQMLAAYGHVAVTSDDKR